MTHPKWCIVQLDADGNLRLYVYQGEIAPAFGLPGGGQQVAFPVSIEMLRKLGFLQVAK